MTAPKRLPPKRLPPSQLDALSALAGCDYLLSAQSTHLAEGRCAWGTLNRLRDKGLATVGYLHDTGQRAAWITEEGREAWHAVAAVTPWPRPLTGPQRTVLDALRDNGPWNPDSPVWKLGSPSTTRRELDVLVRKGWARIAENGDYIPTQED